MLNQTHNDGLHPILEMEDEDEESVRPIDSDDSGLDLRDIASQLSEPRLSSVSTIPARTRLQFLDNLDADAKFGLSPVREE